MNSTTCPRSGKKIRTGVLLLVGLLILGATLWGAFESRKRTDTRIRQELIRQAVSIAAALPIEEVQALSFTPGDKDRPEYQYLSRSLHAYAKTAGLRSIYTLSRLDPNTLAFGPESLKPDDIYASAPGEIYQQPLPENFEIFKTATPFATGPYTDEYGSFISAYAPVIHPRSGQVLAVIGVDIEQQHWHLALRRAQWLPVLLITFPLGLLAFIMIQGGLPHPDQTEHSKFSQKLLPALCGLIMLLLTAGTTWLFYQMERFVREETFHTTALLKAEIYANKLKALQNDITGLTAFFDSSSLVDSAEFNQFCAQTLADHPIDSVAWCPRVPASHLEAFENELRREGLPDFSYRPLPNATGKSEITYPARYVFGITGEPSLPGYDTYSTPLRREAIDTAFRSGRATASAPLTLSIRSQESKGFLIFQPVTTPREQGVLSIIIQPAGMMRRFGRLSASISSGLSGYLFEITPDAAPFLFAGPKNDSGSRRIEVLNSENLRRIVPVLAFGRTYMLAFQPNARWYQTHTLQNWKTALFAGLSLTGFLTGLLVTLTNRPAVLEKHVRARTAELRNSEQRFRDLINTIPDLVWLKDPDGHYLNCNRRFEKFFDASEKDILGKTDYAFVDSTIADDFRAHDLKAIETRQPIRYEESIQFASDGHQELLETVKTPLYDEQNQLIGTLGISRDITERKQTEEALQKSEEKLRRIIENSTNMFYSHTPEGLLTYVSPQVKNILGYEKNDALKNWQTLTSDHPANQQAFLSTEKALRTGKAQPPYEVQLIHREGHMVWAEVREAPLIKNGKTVAMVGSLTDITVRKQALEEKEQSQNLLRSILDTIPIRVWWKDSQNRFMGINRGCALEMGLQSPEDIIGKTDHDLFPKENADHYVTDDEEVRDTGRPKLGIEEVILLSDNNLRWQETNKVPLRNSQGNIIGTVGTGTDITDRKQSEAELQRSRRLLEQVINANPDLLWMKNPDGTFLMCNTQFEKLVGVPQTQLIGKTDYDFFPVAQADDCKQQDLHALQKKATSTYQEFLRHAGKNKDVFYETIKTPVYDHGDQPIGVLGIGRDITERVKLESTVRQAQKLDSIGQLAGGVAHDFNNMLMGIMGYIELSRTQISANHPVQEFLDEMYRISERSADLTRKLLGFARKQITAPRELNLNDTIHGMLKMLRRLIGEDVELIWEPGEDLWEVSMDPSQVDQILVNLCVNARDAIKGVGSIRISTSNIRLDAKSCTLLPGATPGEYILIKVTDTGKGLAPNIRERIFEPFFTTKDIGEGTGLGLSTVHGIIKQNSGHIQVQSREQEGTTFFINIPRLVSKDVTHEVDDSMTEVLKGTETLLLVEDDHSILDITTLILENQGYQVLAASSPLEALELVKQHTGKLDLMITDVVMPGMSGPDLAKQLMTQDPNLKCIFMSGYTAEFITPEDIQNPLTAFLPKPFSGIVLNHAVRKLLDSTPL